MPTLYLDGSTLVPASGAYWLNGTAALATPPDPAAERAAAFDVIRPAAEAYYVTEDYGLSGGTFAWQTQALQEATIAVQGAAVPTRADINAQITLWTNRAGSQDVREGWNEMSKYMIAAAEMIAAYVANGGAIEAEWQGTGAGSLWSMTQYSAQEAPVSWGAADAEGHGMIAFWSSVSGSLAAMTEFDAADTAGEDSAGWRQSTANQARIRAACKLLVASSKFSTDANPQHAAYETWLVDFFVNCNALDLDYYQCEITSSYAEEYLRAYHLLIGHLPAAHPTIAVATALRDRYVERTAALAIGGIVDTAASRDKARLPGCFPVIAGAWAPLEGEPPYTYFVQRRGFEWVGMAAGAAYTPSATVIERLDHMGLTETAALMTFEMGDNPTGADTRNRMAFRAARYQDLANRVAWCVSSLGDMPSFGPIVRDPPRYAKIALRNNATFASLWVCGGYHASNDGTDEGLHSQDNESVRQHRNVLLITGVGLVAPRPTAPLPTAAGLRGPVPMDDLDELDGSDGNWMFARFGRIYVAWWFWAPHTLDLVNTIQQYGSSGTWPGPLAPSAQVYSLGADNAAIVAVYHQGHFSSFETFKAALLGVSPTWVDSTLTVPAMPVCGTTTPDAVTAVNLVAVHKGAFTVGGVAQAVPSAPPTITLHAAA